MAEKNSLHILVLDDNKHDYQSIKRVLKLHLQPCQVSHITKIAKLLKTLKTKQPDIILIDSRLPDGDGLEALQLLKNLYINTPAIFISGTENVKDAVDAIQLGARDSISSKTFKKTTSNCSPQPSAAPTSIIKTKKQPKTSKKPSMKPKKNTAT